MTNKIKNESHDTRYFTITPRLVWALSRTPHDYTFWCVVKMIAGDNEECILGTDDLATMAMISKGGAHNSRDWLIKMGLLEGEVRQDPGYQAVWHLRVPDIWKRSIEWAEAYIKLRDRVAWKAMQKKAHKEGQDLELIEAMLAGLPGVHPLNAEEERSPHEHPRSPHERERSPHETKNIPKNNHKKNPIPARQPAQATELEYDYDDLDGSGGDPDKTEQGWMQPELPIHHQVLDVAHAKRFQKTRWKKRLTGLAQAIASGDILGGGVYQACLDGLDKCENGVVQEPLPPIPASWLDWRLEQARRNRWSIGGTVDALFSREALVKHCQYHLREMGAAVPAKEVQYEDADLGAVEVINL